MIQMGITFLSLANTGDHVIVTARGRFDLQALESVFSKLEISIGQRPGCKILIDLRAAIYDLSPLQTYNFVNALAPDSRLATAKVALVSKAEIQQFDRIFLLCAFLSNTGLCASVFRDAKEAARWLSE